MLDCPNCSEDSYDGALCRACGFTAGKPRPDAKHLAASHKEASLPPAMTKAEWDQTREIGRSVLAKAKAMLKRDVILDVPNERLA